MTIEQVGRSYNSITVNVSGIVDGDRQTYIYLHSRIDGVGGKYKLSEARDLGYINFYVKDVSDNNGDIDIYIPDKYLDTKAYIIEVHNVNRGDGKACNARIPVFLMFEYDNSSQKKAGNPIDITHNDMAQINLFGRDMLLALSNDRAYYFPAEELESYHQIYADFLSLPAENIYAASNYAKDYLMLYAPIQSFVSNIVNNVVSGEEFKAIYFTYIQTAINNFDLSITV